MKVTVCELPNDPSALEDAWKSLCIHTKEQKSDFVLLPELPFFRWLMADQNPDSELWLEYINRHNAWIERLPELGAPVAAATRPLLRDRIRLNSGFIWDSELGATNVHEKYYLPDEPGFWEASWYSRGAKDFEAFQTAQSKIGFLICTELWFNQHAREYGKQGVQLLLCPRANLNPNWITGGQTAAFVSGAYCLSSNFSGKTPGGKNFAGIGWIIEPSEGKILGTTSTREPYLTMENDLTLADKAKKTYPRYVRD